jgi:hypothetical protein
MGNIISGSYIGELSGRPPGRLEERLRLVKFEDSADQGAEQSGWVGRARPKTVARLEARDNAMKGARAAPSAGNDAANGVAGQVQIVTHASPGRRGGFHRRDRVRRRR